MAVTVSITNAGLVFTTIDRNAFFARLQGPYCRRRLCVILFAHHPLTFSDGQSLLHTPPPSQSLSTRCLLQDARPLFVDAQYLLSIGLKPFCQTSTVGITDALFLFTFIGRHCLFLYSESRCLRFLRNNSFDDFVTLLSLGQSLSSYRRRCRHSP